MNIRRSFEGSRARIGHRPRGWQAPTVKTGAQTKGSSATDSLSSDVTECNGWKALVIQERRNKQSSATVCGIKNIPTVGRGCYTPQKKCNFRQVPNLDSHQFFAICNLQSAICNRLRVPPPARGVLADTAKPRECFRETLALVPFHPSIPLRRNGLKSEG